MSGQPDVVTGLLARSNRLGSDPRNTNYAGGNTSAKGLAADPVTGDHVELLWVKGSGGDLGTLTAPGLAVLRLDRLRALTGVYPGVGREDEMVAAFDYCLHGKGGAAPSIDTAMHGLVDAAHVDHLHPDSGIALATAADGEALTRDCFGDRVLWVPWRRPGFQLGLDIAAVARDNRHAIGVILGGHGITAWGATSDECEARSLEIIATAQRYLEKHGSAEPFGPVLPGYEPLPEAQRHARAALLAPVLRGLASTDSASTGLASTGLASTGLGSTGLASTGGEVSATADGDGGWRLTGQVPCVLDGAGASLILVAASTGEGPALFAVQAGAPGLTAVALETLDLTRREARLSFDAVPAELASDPAQAAWLTRVRALAALAVAAGSLGGIRRCLEMATGYAKERTAFGRTIGSFQAVKHMCADMLVDLECTRAAVEHAAKVADQADEAGPPGEAAAAALPAACSVAKAYASDAVVRAATTLIQVHGGLGFTWEHDAHLFYRRAFSDEQLFGDAAAHRAQLAAALVVPA